MSIVSQSNPFVNNDLQPSFIIGRGFADFYGYLPLPAMMVRELGSKTLTLSALVNLPEVRGKGETFRRIDGIASEAGMPVRTVKRHLDWLEKSQFMVNTGRHKRRTATRNIGPAIRDGFKPGSAIGEYYPLPRFVLDCELTWNDRLVLAFYCYKSFRFTEAPREAANVSQAETARQTGLQRLAVREANRRLERRGLIDCTSVGIMLRV